MVSEVSFKEKLPYIIVFLLILSILVLLFFIYFYQVNQFELNAYPRETQDFNFIIQRSEYAKNCTDVSSSQNSNNYLSIDSTFGRVDGHLNFKLLCNIPNSTQENYWFNIYLSNLSHVAQPLNKTGIVKVFSSNRVVNSDFKNTSLTNLRIIFNSSSMKQGEKFQVIFDLYYSPQFYNKYYVTMEDAIINFTIFIFKNDYICGAECFATFDPEIVHYSIIPYSQPDYKLMLYTKRFDVSASRLFFRFSPQSRYWLIRSKIIDAVLLGLIAGLMGVILYEFLFKRFVVKILKGNNDKKIYILINREKRSNKSKKSK